MPIANFKLTLPLGVSLINIQQIFDVDILQQLVPDALPKNVEPTFSLISLQAKLQEFLGRKELDKHLDADEAIVLGASLHAANLSDGIKLNRKLGMIDGSMYGIFLDLDGPDLVKDETTRQLIIPRMKKLPSKVSHSLTGLCC